MQRQDMLQKLYERLQGVEMTSDWPDQILTAIEDCGMLPPQNDEKQYVWDAKKVNE
jgi:hypothetical protein